MVRSTPQFGNLVPHAIINGGADACGVGAAPTHSTVLESRFGVLRPGVVAFAPFEGRQRLLTLRPVACVARSLQGGKYY